MNEILPEGWKPTPVEKLKSSDPRALAAGPFGSSISSKFFVNEGVPVIRGCNLSEGKERFISNGFVFITESKAAEFKGTQVRAGDLVFTCWGTLGQVGLIPEAGPFDIYVISNKQLKLRPDPEIASSEFLYYYFSSPTLRKRFNDVAIGAAVPGINLGILRREVVPLPPIDEQKKIAAILTAYDDLIETNKRRIALLEKMAEELYREWFVRMRFPGHQNSKFAKGVPEGWTFTPILEASKIRYGKNLPTSQLAADGDYPVYGAAKIIGRYSNFTHRDRTIALGCRGSVGQVQITLPKSYITNNSFSVEPLDGIGFFWLFHTLMLRGCDDVIGGSAQPQITLDGIKSIKLLMANEKLRANYEELCKPIYSQKWHLDNEIEVLTKTRDLLLPHLISGKLSVEDLDIQFPPSMQEEATESEPTHA